MGWELIGCVGVLSASEVVYWDCSWGNDRHHQIIVLVKCIIGRVKGEWKSGLCMLIRHLGSLIFGKAVIQCLKESTDLVLVCIGIGENYDGFTVIEGRACC